MEGSSNSIPEMDSGPQETVSTSEPVVTDTIIISDSVMEKPSDGSQILFPESPVYEPEEIELVSSTAPDEDKKEKSEDCLEEPAMTKRKNSDELVQSSPKIQKLELVEDEFAVSSQTLDDEVSEITRSKRLCDNLELPSTSRVRTPVRSSPRLLTKRSNSADIVKTPKTLKSRPASVEVTKSTPKKNLQANIELKYTADRVTSRPSIEFVKEIPPPKVPDTIPEIPESLDDSQGLHLEMSPTPDDENAKIKYNSDPILKDSDVAMKPANVQKASSEGNAYSDNNMSIPRTNLNLSKTSDLESTDSVCSMNLESPDHIPSAASKLISKLSNGNSSTPTDATEDSDCTPDMVKLNNIKGKRLKNESFRASNTTTPSTISPLQNGHSLPISTPHVPAFDVHISHNEDNEFLSLYVVRTDNDLGMDMCKEYQRISKRFTIDPYLADVSVSNSPSSVTSGGMINLPNRTSFASTVSSTSTLSSNRTSDGAFVVPQPPRKSVSNPTYSIKGYDALMKKLQEIFSHIREVSDDGGRSISDDKVSIAVQTSLSTESSMSNGNASPEEVSKCDKTTPKSSLKKTRVRGRRPMAAKTKRAILPTQPEEAEFMYDMNSPEMVPSNGDGGHSPKSPKDEKPLSSMVATPKSVSKLKQKRRPNSPRPATPVDKMMKQEYPGHAPDTVVLAKWVDKRYYSGKVVEITDLNKYLIKFDDGQTKVLLDDFIIFGDMKTLPLTGQLVYAVVDEEQNYEPGLVLGVEENDSGTITYKCATNGDTLVVVTASELYLTEEQARALKDAGRPRSPTTPNTTPRRRNHRELDLDNIIQGPRSARSRDKGSSSARKRVASPKSPKASTSGLKTKIAVAGRKRVASESSEISESSNSAPSTTRLEEVAGVEPELQRTPRKIDGVKAGPFQLKGAAKQNIGKKNSKLTKFENDADTVSQLGPIPDGDHKIFKGMYFLLTCAATSKRSRVDKEKERDKKKEKERADNSTDARQYSSEEDSEAPSTVGTDTEDFEFSTRPFNKERLKEQLEAGGGVVYSHFDEIPKNKYALCKLIAPRPCLTAKYIQCLASDVRAVLHDWVIASCSRKILPDVDAHALPAGLSVLHRRYITWDPPGERRNATFFKDKIILLCGDQDTFVKFWERVCNLTGATTRVVNEEDLNMTGAFVLVTDWECPHEVQNKANQDGIPLVSTHWVIECLIQAEIVDPTCHDSFSFMYTEPE